MSNVVDFMFNNLSRIGQDEYNYTQDNKMNNGYSSYMLTNLYNTNEKKAFQIASNHPTLNLKGTNGVGPLGYNIDDSSKLINSKLTNLNCKINLQERSYKTIPYLGKGNVDVALENKLRFGDTLREKKSVLQLNEKCLNDVKTYPLDNGLKQQLSSGIEENAVKGWIRGGMPSREIYKNKDYQCN
jgi:hypothetical protein